MKYQVVKEGLIVIGMLERKQNRIENGATNELERWDEIYQSSHSYQIETAGCDKIISTSHSFPLPCIPPKPTVTSSFTHLLSTNPTSIYCILLSLFQPSHSGCTMLKSTTLILHLICQLTLDQVNIVCFMLKFFFFIILKNIYKII